MNIIDINKIIINKTVLGVECPCCSGDLTAFKNKSIIPKLIRTLSLGMVKVYSYKCRNCSKLFILV